MTAPDIRAKAIEVLARELFAVDADLAGYGPDDFEDWAPRYRRKAEPYVDALAEAGLLPTEVESTRVYDLTGDGAGDYTAVRYVGPWRREEGE
ncbi:hypothetical protein [Nocardia farcinica]|uniref:hypothetical protein n=1 Tax=Nocardia farcinica TaxID=37329 RepID=UPI0024582507|nr:hypothetical protein [Nocardia farcinica]